VAFVTRPRKPLALWTALESRYSPIVCIEGSSVRRRSEHFIRTGRGGFIVAHHSGVAQGRGSTVIPRDLCLDGLGKKKASDEKKQGKMRLCNGTSLVATSAEALAVTHLSGECHQRIQTRQRKPPQRHLLVRWDEIC
jgi:hypothetical protein